MGRQFVRPERAVLLAKVYELLLGCLELEKLMRPGGCLCRTMITLGTLTLFACAPHRIHKIEYSEPTGREIYMSQCANCHGEDGKGDLIAVSGSPDGRADLTMLSKRNGGTFPTERLKEILGGLVDIPAHHDSNPMPIWGDLFDARRETARQAAADQFDRLAAYLESIQQK